ncbi:MAG: hypothetical protein AVDCRST_MAG03-1080 [uncultured Rubrobacteraceae bacterium]|uniref:DUF2255 family protein n=1 Tax=uncultured Rubrobacteraceae bacterium TaxID=349277 RepID=A0A6J4NVX2_9ACTN|nr:MAG: hypothetical protein AVDCRST_MAG03-1080 [uncultured Rubrobacteraceae bacterium]
MTEGHLDQEILAALDGTDEVHVETSRDATSSVHRTVIWAVVVDGGAFVRSVRGEKGRWYREASANPDVTLHVGDRRVPVRAVPETDARTIEGVSEAIREKYGTSFPGPTAAMLREEVLATTLRLIPA